jgi:hypothetical protein
LTGLLSLFFLSPLQTKRAPPLFRFYTYTHTHTRIFLSTAAIFFFTFSASSFLIPTEKKKPKREERKRDDECTHTHRRVSSYFSSYLSPSSSLSAMIYRMADQ